MRSSNGWAEAEEMQCTFRILELLYMVWTALLGLSFFMTPLNIEVPLTNLVDGPFSLLNESQVVNPLKELSSMGKAQPIIHIVLGRLEHSRSGQALRFS
ncbi:unnamed protein product [Haemonchus placei]|uniref:Uncharacterized protein n=1 Tax=Haemonchus placei TaxID=6290 RepID=A0A0N4W5Q9_HAEPC|nr:unnamed protein product [Haemonchus placei]